MGWIFYSISSVARYRGNVMKQRGTLAAAFRAVIRNLNLDDLGLPQRLSSVTYPVGLSL